MRDKEKKHRKGQETTIGKIIYGFLLFMPLIAILTTCLTCLWNKTIKNENEVATINYKYTTNEVNTFNDLYNERIYRITLNSFPSATDRDLRAFDVFNLKALQYFNVETTTENTEIVIEFRTNGIQLRNTEYIAIAGVNLTQNDLPYTFDIVYKNSSTLTAFKDYYTITESTYNEIENVEITTQTTEFDTKNVFYYSVDKVTESPLFNWAENSIIYTTTNTTCNALSITTPFIPLLMSYWLIISVIYFLYDIALMLVWLIHRKIHELQESL